MLEIHVCPPLLPQVSIDPSPVGAGEPAVTGVMDGEEEEEDIVVGAGVSLD